MDSAKGGGFEPLNFIMYYLPYNRKLKQFSRNLRNKSTLGEVLLWKQLKGKQLNGYQFNRQKPLGNYIADFYCKKLSLVIEVDGSIHDYLEEYDKKKDDFYYSLSLSVIRLDEYEVRDDVVKAMEPIITLISEFEACNGKS